VRSQKTSWQKRHGFSWKPRVSGNATRTPTLMRDPNDDMILACAVAAAASHVVTRDDDLLSLGTHEGVTIVTPEAFLAFLRSAE